MDIFTLKDGRRINIDWRDYNSVCNVSKSDMSEVREQIEKYLELITLEGKTEKSNCRNCGNNNNLSDSDAGSDREIVRLC